MKNLLSFMLLASLLGCSTTKQDSLLANDPDYRPPAPVHFAPVMLNPDQLTTHYYRDANGQLIPAENNAPQSLDTTDAYYKTIMRSLRHNGNAPIFNSDPTMYNRTLPSTIQKVQ